MSVTAINSGARIATKINKAPGVRVPVTIASHSWNWTRISVARKTPVPPHRSPSAIRSLRVDRATDDREPLREGLGFVEVMRRQEDRAPLSRQVPQDVPHGAPGERVESDRRLVQK